MCANRHVLVPGRVLVGWLPCSCPGAEHGGHRTWTCRDCMDAGVGDEATLLAGRHDPAGAVARGPEFGTASTAVQIMPGGEQDRDKNAT